jgi:flagellar biosynthesis repressor protein FlbT
MAERFAGSPALLRGGAMSLKLELKAGERFLVGDCLLVNVGGRARLSIEGDAPVLRERDMLRPDRANSAAKRLYVAVQSMYLTREPERFRAEYLRLSREIAAADPAAGALVATIEHLVAIGQLYKAMREAQHLVAMELQRAMEAPSPFAATA